MVKRHVTRDSRAVIFAAAAEEFASHGYAAAGVDRIAAAAGVNKAMLYYHFGSKRGLHTAVLLDMLDAVGARIKAIAASDASPEAKIDAWVQAIIEEGRARPHFPAIMLRELAEGLTQLDTAVLARMLAVFDAVRHILDHGRRTGRFRTVHPLLMHLTILAPTVLFIARDRALARGGRRRLPAHLKEFAARVDPETFVRHMQQMARRTLAKD